MSEDFTVLGGNQLRVLGAKLKVADKKLRLEMGRNIRLATKPVIAKQRDAARSRLPKTGGLAARVADAKIGTQIKTAGKSVGVTIKARKTQPGIDKGTVRHPVFGNKGKWVTEDVEPGWFTDPAEESAPEMRHALKEAMDHTLRELT